MKNVKLKMNKLVYLRLSILEINKILMYKFWYDYIKPNYQDNAYEDIGNEGKKRFDT